MIIGVTGARSDISSALAVALQSSGHQVKLAPPSETVNLLGDVRLVQAWLQESEPDVLVHLAGSKPPASIRDMFANNVGGTCGLVEAMNRAGSGARLVIASSASVYGALRPGEIATVHRALRPANPYGWSKVSQEDLATRACAGVRPLTIARIFNVVGASHDAYSVLPSLVGRIKGYRSGDVLHVKASNCVRDFIDVTDVASALIAACDAEASSGIVNVCTGIPTTVMHLAQMISDYLSKPVRFEFLQADETDGDVLRSVGDPSQAQALGWQPHSSLEVAIKRTVSQLKTLPISTMV